MERPVFAANWKMNHGPTEARKFIRDFKSRYAARRDRTVIFFPPALSVSAVIEARGDRNDLLVGVQNIWTEAKGAFTGENCAPMARDAGASFALVGHSERRHVFGETDAQTSLKCAAAVKSGLTPMLCVGELLEERDARQTEAVVLRQLHAGIKELAPDSVRTMAVAYEPVWAIGTGQTATPADASAVHAKLRTALQAIIGDAAATLPILYGGSVNATNASGLLRAPGVDGLLVGGASLDPESWAAICNI